MYVILEDTDEQYAPPQMEVARIAVVAQKGGDHLVHLAIGRHSETFTESNFEAESQICLSSHELFDALEFLIAAGVRRTLDE